MAGLSTLSRLQRITLILFVIMVANWVMVSTTGYSLLGGDLFTLFFIVFFVLLGVTFIPPVVRRVVWRVRHRLLVSYFFVGVLPIVLIVIFVCFGFYLVLMQTANYLLHVEIEKRLDLVLNSAERLAQDLSAGRQVGGQDAADGLVLRASIEHVRAEDPVVKPRVLPRRPRRVVMRAR